jgi:hypothetical protein
MSESGLGRVIRSGALPVVLCPADVLPSVFEHTC